MRDYIQMFFDFVGIFFILYMIGYATFLFLSVTVGSSVLYGTKRRNMLKNELSNDYYIPVSVIIPAYNEAVTIESTIRSLLALDYRLYEIIVGRRRLDRRYRRGGERNFSDEARSQTDSAAGKMSADRRGV